VRPLSEISNTFQRGLLKNQTKISSKAACFTGYLIYLCCLNLLVMILQNTPVLLSIFQPEHMLVIFLAVVLLFGGKKIPELMRGIGQGVREFKDAKDTVKNELEEGMKEKDKDEEIKQLRQQLQQQQLLQQQKEMQQLPK
jgi:sec-independent protein translocase protein TatA